jgi:O-antigen ligase
MASLTVFAGFALAIVIVSGQMLVTRLVALVNAGDADRSALFSLSLAAVTLHPWAGWGLGSFESAFSVLQPAHVALVYDRAHNVYLETAVELGIPAACLLVAAITFLAVRCAFGIFQRNRDAHYPAIGFGAALFVGFHSLFDFSIQIPAVAIAFSTVLGLGWTQSRSSRQS